MSYKISHRIEMACKHLKIKYKSKHFEKSNFHVDALRLLDLYDITKQVIGEMIEIANKHGVEDLSAMLWNDINLLENVDHDIFKIAKLMNKRGKYVDNK